MNVQLYETPDGFGPVARWVYRRDPVTFTTELTTLCTSTWPADRVLVAAYDGDGAVGAAVQMPDGVLLVNGLPPTLSKETALALAPVQSDLSAVRGTPSTAGAFAQAWSEATGTDVSTAFEETLYRLGELTAPADVPGVPRLAGRRDEELLTGWFDAFYVEAFGSESNPAASRALVAGIPDARGRVVLWTVDDEPVAMARVHGCLLGMARIGPVYTPQAHRARGYGAAVTAEAACQARGMGARDVVLFADDANPTSNGVYRRLGFLPVGESVQYAFTPRT